ncbi:hypothetical protein BKA70DRAFT_1218792 [Coprinopsis sp. MPI-PUGE-AT-0042]|nr:hypothetical protein BKA70DRAFT_1218792 [Coprinopsis sp. MPI-PUGE-AT-0042]
MTINEDIEQWLSATHAGEAGEAALKYCLCVKAVFEKRLIAALSSPVVIPKDEQKDWDSTLGSLQHAVKASGKTILDAFSLVNRHEMTKFICVVCAVSYQVQHRSAESAKSLYDLEHWKQALSELNRITTVCENALANARQQPALTPGPGPGLGLRSPLLDRSIAAPNITYLLPSRGPIFGGTEVLIAGSHFEGGKTRVSLVKRKAWR